MEQPSSEAQSKRSCVSVSPATFRRSSSVEQNQEGKQAVKNQRIPSLRIIYAAINLSGPSQRHWRCPQLCLRLSYLMSYDVVFINIVINVAIIFLRGLEVLPAAVTEGCALLVTSAQGHLLVGLRDKTVTRLWLSLQHRWGNNSGDDYSDDGDVRVALTCHSCPH